MLLDLPTDTVLQVLKDCDKTDLHLLSLTSKTARRLAEPFLYANIEYVPGKPGSLSTPPLQLLLRTMLQRPELALRIKRLSLNTPWDYDFDCHYTVTEHLPCLQLERLSPDMAKRALRLVHETGFPEIPRWQEALNQGSTDAVVALFLSQLKRLEVLVIELQFVHRSFFLGTALQHLIRNQPSYFGCLRSIECREKREGYRARDLEREVCEVFPYFYLPRLESLELTLHIYDFEAWYPKDLSLQACPSLTTLRLFYCTLFEDQIAKMLALAPSLKTFRCGLLCSDDPDDRGDFNFQHLQSSLSAVSNTLEDLTITTTMCGKNGQLDLSPKEMGIVPMGSLQHLRTLSHLELSAVLLLGEYPSHEKRLSDLLPGTLRSLTLILIDESYTNRFNTKPEDSPEPPIQAVIDILEVYLAESMSSAPLLEELTLKSPRACQGDTLKISYQNALSKKAKQLQAMAQTFNVAIRIDY